MRQRLKPIDDNKDWYYLAALVPNSKAILYIRVVKGSHTDVVDMLHDEKCKVVKLAEWKWRMQLNDKRHPDWDQFGEVFEVDEETTFDPFKSKDK